jgi:3'(2'), 5'-bisphosphate nucleotidase
MTQASGARIDVEPLCDIAREAGRQICDLYDPHGPAWTKADNSPLTRADLRAHEIIDAGLRAAFPGVPVWSEEGPPLAADPAPSEFFLVDPLDGTKEFLAGNGEFTVNIAFVRHGQPVAGVVFVPVPQQLYVAAQGWGAFRRDAQGEVPLRTAPLRPGAPLRVIGSRSHGGAAQSAWLQKLAGGHTFVAAGSSLKFCRIAEGAADVYARLSPTSQWDTAAAQAVLECAGGAVLDPQGKDLRYGPGRPVLNPFFIALARRGMDVPAIA